MIDEVKREVKWIAFGFKDIVIILFAIVIFCGANHYIRGLHHDWRLQRFVEKERITQSILNQVPFPVNLANAFRQAGWNARTQEPAPMVPNVQENFEDEEPAAEEEKE